MTFTIRAMRRSAARGGGVIVVVEDAADAWQRASQMIESGLVVRAFDANDERITLRDLEDAAAPGAEGTPEAGAARRSTRPLAVE